MLTRQSDRAPCQPSGCECQSGWMECRSVMVWVSFRKSPSTVQAPVISLGSEVPQYASLQYRRGPKLNQHIYEREWSILDSTTAWLQRFTTIQCSDDHVRPVLPGPSRSSRNEFHSILISPSSLPLVLSRSLRALLPTVSVSSVSVSTDISS